MVHCTACGHAIPNEARFCRSCGAKQDVQVEQESQPNTTAKPPSGAPEDDQHSTLVEDASPESTILTPQVPTFADWTPDTPPSSGRKWLSNRKRLIGGGVALVAVVICTVLAIVNIPNKVPATSKTQQASGASPDTSASTTEVNASSNAAQREAAYADACTKLLTIAASDEAKVPEFYSSFSDANILGEYQLANGCVTRELDAEKSMGSEHLPKAKLVRVTKFYMMESALLLAVVARHNALPDSRCDGWPSLLDDVGKIPQMSDAYILGMAGTAHDCVTKEFGADRASLDTLSEVELVRMYRFYSVETLSLATIVARQNLSHAH